MVKKKFIDKKRSVTYSLVYRSKEDDPSQQPAGPSDEVPEGLKEGRYPPGHPLAWLEEEQDSTALHEDRRRELIEHGFPDDGYDYLKHLRTLGRGAGSLEGLESEDTSLKPGLSEEAPSGPSVFVPASTINTPQDDIAIFDAASLTVAQPAERDEDVTEMMGGVSAFARRRDGPHVMIPSQHELEQLAEAMAELEAVELEDGAIEGFGDLLDDFVVEATMGGSAATGLDDGGNNEPERRSEEAYEDSQEEYDDDDEEKDYSDDASSSSSLPEDGVVTGGGRQASTSARPGSIASTYWREERTDRRNLLGVIDERFERLALEYDDDEIGDMDDAAYAGAIQGFADVEQFDVLLDEFLEARRANSIHAQPEPSQKNVTEKKVAHRSRPWGESILKAQMEAYGFSDDDAEMAIEGARVAIRRAEEAEASGQAEMTELVTTTGADWNSGQKERWDCESILSLKSNIYNHPGRIAEPRGKKDANKTIGRIQLDKSGLPMGVLLPRRSDGSGPITDAGDMNAGDQMPSAMPILTELRRKDESAEEKRLRKAAVKSAKREARTAKKQLKSLYKEEAAKASRRAATAHVQPAVHL